MAFRVTIALLIQAQVHFADRTVYFRLILLTFFAAVGAPLPDRHDDWQVLWNRVWPILKNQIILTKYNSISSWT